MPKESENKVIKLRELVEQPQSLRLLILHTPYFLDLKGLDSCTNLIKLNLSKNNITTLPCLSGMAKLKFLFLHSNDLNYASIVSAFFEELSIFSPLAHSVLWVTYEQNQ